MAHVSETNAIGRTGRVAIPSWLRQHADLWIQHPRVESIVLFGSRVTGHATSRSDWDVAVLHKGANPPKLERLDEFWNHHVDVPMLSIQKLRQEANCVGSLSHELLSHGEVIAGDVLSFEIEELVMSQKDLALHLEYAFVELASAICGLRDATRTTKVTESIEELDGERAVAHSANGAERVAKALCVYLKIPYERTHSVEELSSVVPAEWKSRVLAMDGFTSSGHTSPYTGISESIHYVAHRIQKALDLLREILPRCLEELSTANAVVLIRKIKGATPLHTSTSLIDDSEVHPTISGLAQELGELRRILRIAHTD